MTDDKIYELACVFKKAMLAAQDDGVFERDDVFSCFPTGCCGDTCELLATFLKDYNIETIYVWGDYRDQSHAWLVVNDGRVKAPTLRCIDAGDEYARLVNQYGGNTSGQIEDTSYKVRDLTYGLVIDITADQFGGPPVYVGERNGFYRKHTFRRAYICDGVSDGRLSNLYRNIAYYLPKQC